MNKKKNTNPKKKRTDEVLRTSLLKSLTKKMKACDKLTEIDAAMKAGKELSAAQLKWLFGPQYKYFLEIKG